MDQESNAIQERAIEVLRESPDGLSYRDLVTQVSILLENVGRDLVSTAIGNLPKDRAEAVWRPRPGHFKIRGQNEGPTVYARGRKRRVAPVEESKPAWPARPLPNRVENLVKLGFAEVGYWERSADGVECVYTAEVDPKQALVAYVLGDSVMYIGRPGRIHAGRSGYILRSVRNALAKDRMIRVFALTEWESCSHCGMDVNVAAGIEDELAERMQPPWNNFPA